MSTTQKQNRLARRILETDNEQLLDRIAEMLDQNPIVGYTNGKAIHQDQYQKELDQDLSQLENGTATTYTTAQIRQNMRNAYGLD